MRIGEYLKRQREIRECDLDFVARVTKIPSQWLQAIESDDFQQLPGRTFAKGYIRAYADCIGLDVNEVMLRFEDEFAC